MPGVQRLAIRRLNVERRDLVLRKSKALAVGQIIAHPQCVESIGIQSAGPISFYFKMRQFYRFAYNLCMEGVSSTPSSTA